ncbi:antitoxin [Streptomyces sp. ISL-112]|uniref:antitoxin n=1 Tax=unclassified Streptomyces TaxID=2593676 RepID=UPI001BEC2D65|nr:MULTISPECIES: antitoxin [unclassified Streptomyces]MBT2426441.1 antitoxin [Streptomyces sp. ISL-112]MBT2462343.1 antitoxin [Streptomyces sp. ISL-63]
MSALDRIKKILKGHEDQAGKGTDKTGDGVDGRTQGKYSGQVDSAQDKLRQQFGTERDQDGPPRS